MRLRTMLAIGVVLLLPCLSQSEVLYLRDGSTLQGTLLRMSNDTLYVKTSFGAIVPMHKSVVLRIDFDSLGVATAVPVSRVGVAAPALAGGREYDSSAPPGTLMVVFDKFDLSSEVVVERRRNEKEILAANAIEALLLVNGEKMHSQIDSTMDKVIRKGPETLYRNEIRPAGYSIVLPPGRYQCDFRITNSMGEPWVDSFQDGLLEKRLLRDDVQIQPNTNTQIRIGLKKKLKGLGSSYLYEIIH